MEKVVDNRGNPIIYFCSSKDFKNAWKKKINWKEITSALGICNVSAQTSYNTMITSFKWNKQEVCEIGKKK